MPFKLTVKFHGSDGIVEDTFATIEEAHAFRATVPNAIADDIAEEEVFEVDEKGYRVVSSPVIFHCKIGRAQQEADFKTALGTFKARYEAVMRMLGTDFGNLINLGFDACNAQQIALDEIQKMLNELNSFMADGSTIFMEAGDARIDLLTKKQEPMQ